ncbi:MAG: spermidine synthase [Nitrospirae bacterium]|nr:spermidine synthase [Nitrospirota bacterium]
MAQPWQTIDRIERQDNMLELRKRGDRDFLLLVNGRVLMNSSASRSEVALGEQACRLVTDRPRPRVLIGGLGMGFTLRAALDVLPSDARIVVAELNPAVVKWCRGPLADLTKSASSDPRVSIETDDVAAVIIGASSKGAERYDAIIIDLYVGPGADTDEHYDPFYGSLALQTTAHALTPGGIFAVWGENPDAAFEKRLSSARFTVERLRPGRGGLRHVVYVATKRGP